MVVRPAGVGCGRRGRMHFPRDERQGARTIRGQSIVNMNGLQKPQSVLATFSNNVNDSVRSAVSSRDFSRLTALVTLPDIHASLRPIFSLLTATLHASPYRAPSHSGRPGTTAGRSSRSIPGYCAGGETCHPRCRRALTCLDQYRLRPVTTRASQQQRSR